jgi:crossover junction endodeoxyribonuclease RusA
VSTLEIRVNGIPAPQGSKRHVGGGRMVEMSKAVGPWREAVRSETQRAIESWRPGKGLPINGTTCAVGVHVIFTLIRPKSHHRPDGSLRPGVPERPRTRPDVDKLTRAVLDGLTAGGAFEDDAQVVSLVAEKYYADGDPVGARIIVRLIEEA